MKKHLLLILIPVFGVVLSQEYKPLVQLNNQWIEAVSEFDKFINGMNYWDYHYRFASNEPLIYNDKNYYELEYRKRNRNAFQTGPWSNWMPAKFYLAEDIENKLVYVYYPDSTNHLPGEYLLYNFNLEVGDEMSFWGFRNGMDLNLPILAITYENVFGVQNVKTYHLEYDIEYPMFPIKIYEGIGTSMGVINVGLETDYGWELLEFGENLQTLENSLVSVNVSPNPFSNKINISSSQSILHFEIYDITGKKILESKSLEKLNNQLPSLNAGVYVLKLNFQNNTSQTVKLIKK